MPLYVWVVEGVDGSPDTEIVGSRVHVTPSGDLLVLDAYANAWAGWPADKWGPFYRVRRHNTLHEPFYRAKV